MQDLSLPGGVLRKRGTQNPTRSYHVGDTGLNKELENKVSLHAQLRYSSEIRQAKSTEAPIWTGAYLGVVLGRGFSYALNHKKAENHP